MKHTHMVNINTALEPLLFRGFEWLVLYCILLEVTSKQLVMVIEIIQILNTLG